jgi:ADP-heptose:LPS heptosyltransferase
MSRGKILVIRGGAIGDFILTLPVFSALRAQFPDSHLEVLGYPHIAQLAHAGGLVNKVQAIEARELAGFFARNGELSEDLRDYFSEFNIIISYLYDPDEIFKTNLLRCAHGQFIQGPHRPDEEAGLHATRTYLKPLERLAIFDADSVPRLSINHQPSTINQIAFHPGSGSDKKNWPESKWAELLANLAEKTKYNFLLVGGEVEAERLPRLAAKLPTKRVQLAQSLPLAELAVRLQSSVAFVGHDSGISHLAVALGVPSLLLWGNTREEIWQPQGEHVSVIRESTGLSNLSPQRVIEEFARVLFKV